MVINFGVCFGLEYLLMCHWDNTKKTDFSTQIVVSITPYHVLNAELTVSPAEVFLNKEYFQVTSASMSLVPGPQNVSGFFPKTVYRLVSDLLGRCIVV